MLVSIRKGRISASNASGLFFCSGGNYSSFCCLYVRCRRMLFNILKLSIIFLTSLGRRSARKFSYQGFCIASSLSIPWTISLSVSLDLPPAVLHPSRQLLFSFPLLEPYRGVLFYIGGYIRCRTCENRAGAAYRIVGIFLPRQ